MICLLLPAFHTSKLHNIAIKKPNIGIYPAAGPKFLLFCLRTSTIQLSQNVDISYMPSRCLSTKNTQKNIPFLQYPSSPIAADLFCINAVWLSTRLLTIIHNGF